MSVPRALVTFVAFLSCVLLGSAASRPASVGTDQQSYGPFDEVTIVGRGFSPGMGLTVQVTDPDGIVRSGEGLGGEHPDTVATDAAGDFSLAYLLVGADIDGTWYAGREGHHTVAVLDQAGQILAEGRFFVAAPEIAECGLATGGTALCMGANFAGQLGNGTFERGDGPVAVAGLGQDVVSVSSSGTHACAALQDGTVWCWGENAAGQLGDGTFSSSSTPVAVIGLDDRAIDVTATEDQSCANLVTGDRVCWGDPGAGLSTPTPDDVASGAAKANQGITGGPAQLAPAAAPAPALLTPSFARAYDPDFFWLPPTVPTVPVVTGPFDPDALSSLTVEICALDDAGQCAGDPIERFSDTSLPMPQRITVEPSLEYFTVNWMTGRSHADRDVNYQVRVLKSGTLLGVVDVDLVQNTPALQHVDASRYLGLVRGQQLTIRFRVQRPTARTRVVINEVESNGGMPGDWAELYNTASVPLDLSGYVIRDNDDTHSHTLPSGTTIPAFGYYMVEEAALGFGLGAADSVRFFTPQAAGLVDSTNWTAHAVTTYGRCPNGVGAFQTNTTSTKGAANDCSIVIRINEIESEGGTPADWVELFNPGPGPANLAGFVFRDSNDAVNFPLQPVVLPAGGYLVLDAVAMGFALDATDNARLFRPDGTVADSYAWAAHAATTYGRCPNGTGTFLVTLGQTRGAANNCFVPVTTLHINEIESNGGMPGDWVELINTGATAIDLSGWRVRDNDDTHNYILPAGSTIAAGAYLMVEEAALNFGLGAADSVRLYDPTGALYETYAWTAHAATTYGRCPNGTGAFTTTTSVTKASANDCGFPIRINEVESNLGTPGDWVELRNSGAAAVNMSGFVFKDNDDTHIYTIPAGTSIAGGGYFVLDEGTFGFGLGGADSARLFDSGGALIDSYAWTAHAATTYGRCPDGTGAFTTTTVQTKGAANACPGVVTAMPWPGDPDVQTIDGVSVFGGNMSGLMYEDSDSPNPGVLWAVRNGPGSLFRLVWNGTIFTPDTTNNWNLGKMLLYPGGGGSPDSEGVTFTSAGPAGGMYVSTERDNNVSGTSRNSILRFDVSAAGATLVATHEWNLTADLPSVGANLGIEGIAWIPDSFLTSRGFFDEGKNQIYAPGGYANHGTGLFFVGVEANGNIYAYALDHVTGVASRVATIASTLAGVMDLQFDADTSDFWAVCDDTCNGRSVILRINPLNGKFEAARLFERPANMPNLNNEGFAIAPVLECVGNRRPVYWSDDSETGGHAIRRGTLSCSALPPPEPSEPVALLSSGSPHLRAPIVSSAVEALEKLGDPWGDAIVRLGGFS